MTRVLILGASGQIASWAIDMLAQQGAELTLFARNKNRIANIPAGSIVIEGSADDSTALRRAVQGQDVVYANLAGNIDDQAKAVVEAMEAEGVKRLIFVTALGIYQEVPGEFGRWNRSTIGAATLDTYATASDIVEASTLDYTVLRPAWLSDADEVSYETTARDEPFKGTTVSRKSVAALVADLVANPQNHVRENLGVNKPGTDGEQLVW
ncbi:NAD-dependent dehydratase [Glutamicibacter halophytocola]|uniref:NAD(P)H-binding protein n=1 Tax=Glutamicibacter halophytocola TaxID=1933880 RepID=UPI0006D4BF34|nr:NAD(P)H-binding protein [Glutamicibacter halophytocola]ALG30397.1 NAD-dependent dehydratase [Glutamicibacter halophytocola]